MYSILRHSNINKKKYIYIIISYKAIILICKIFRTKIKINKNKKKNKNKIIKNKNKNKNKNYNKTLIFYPFSTW